MSFSSRNSPRFSYASGSSPHPTEFLGQTSFWSDGAPRTVMRSNPRPEPQDALYYRHAAERAQAQGQGLLSSDERVLITALGVGIIVALLVDAVAHAR